MRRKNRFKQGSIGWKKYQDELSSTNGRNTLAVQLPTQAVAMNTPPAQQSAHFDSPTVQVDAPPAAQSAQFDAPPAAQSSQVDAPPAAQSAQVDAPPAAQSAQSAQADAPPAAQSAQSARFDAPPAAQSVQVNAPPAAQSAQSAQADAPPAAQSARFGAPPAAQSAQSVQDDAPPAEQSAQVAMLSACLELSNLSTEVLMGNLNKDVPVVDRIYEPMTSTIVCNTGTRDAATECIIALQLCAPFRAHQTQYTSNATDQSLSQPTSFRSTFADCLLTSECANKNCVGDKPPGC